jgi:hypothetical protein
LRRGSKQRWIPSARSFESQFTNKSPLQRTQSPDSLDQSPALKNPSLETLESPISSVPTTSEGQDPFPELSLPKIEFSFLETAFPKISFPENSGPTLVFDNPICSKDQAPTRNSTQPPLPLVTPSILATV